MMQAPLYIPLATSVSKEVYGGKANSLFRLNEAGFEVPPAWVVPCEYTFSKPKLNFNNLNATRLYAVRSGAPVSMPGLLTTRLNVPFLGLEEAADAVWDSWHTEQAIAYRTNKGIENTGTGVVFQQMVNAATAGVAFTSNPNTPECTDFDPIVEYVEGLGDQLVGGEVQPERADLVNSKFKRLVPYLRNMHCSWGPSDVEWCISKENEIFFVQQRGLKFVASQVIAADKDPLEGSIIAQGRAIGSPVIKVLQITFRPDEAEGKALYVDKFRPELYMAMLKAEAIICRTGGETCHAAIIARECNRPAISGIQYDDTPFGKVCVVNGKTGTISELHEGVKLEEVVSKQVANIEKPKSLKKRRPNLAITEQTFRVNSLLTRFYVTLDKHKKGEVDTEEKDRIIQEIADVLGVYLYCSTVGECRWVNRYVKEGKRHRYFKMLVSSGIAVPSSEATRTNQIATRQTYLDTFVKQPKSLRAARRAVRALCALFNMNWSSGAYGGTKWAVIAETLRAYFDGVTSPTIFVDSVFNLQHNSGQVFGKFTWLVCSGDTLCLQLNAKASSSISKLLQVWNDEQFTNRKSILGPFNEQKKEQAKAVGSKPCTATVSASSSCKIGNPTVVDVYVSFGQGVGVCV